jgi:pimeloyl-ACP methyl ester carboxylesterase
MTQDITEQHIILRDGRKLAYAEFGDPAGWPMLQFHGFPGSRLEGALVSANAAKAGVRVICIDRPGYGGSDFLPDRRIVDWPADVVQLADALGLARFAVMGVSGGGPYAAACARFIPERLRAVALVAGVGPFGVAGVTEGMSLQNRILFGVARFWPGLVGTLMVPMMRRGLRDPDAMIKQMSGSMPEVDRRALEHPGVAEAFVASLAEALRQGARTVSQEAGLYGSNWGFELSSIEMEVQLFQGEVDTNVPPAMGRYQAAQIPKCQAHFYPDEGHMSLALGRSQEILASLAP